MYQTQENLSTIIYGNITQRDTRMKLGTIYGLADPQDNTIKYVGQTINNVNRRLYKHIHDSINPKFPVHKWINLLTQKDLLLKLVILEDHVPDQELSNREKYWINYYIKNDLCNVILNPTKMTIETREQVSKKLRKNLENKRFGYLQVLKYFGSSEHGAMWHCLCDCGNQTVISTHKLVALGIKSCGCKQYAKRVNVG